jgi:multiple sugar transport system substrate-binding protein
MDNLPKDQKDNSGEIFTSGGESGYQEAVAPPQEENPYAETQPPEEQPADTLPPVSGPPPPFVEDNRKKYFVFAIFAVIILAIIFLVAKIIFKPKPPVVSEKVTLSYWGLWEDKEVFQPIIDEYKKNHPNVDINYVSQNKTQYRERLDAALKKGDEPDLFRFHNTWRPMLINYLSAVPKDIYSNEEFEKTFYPVVKIDLKSGDNYYGIPLMIDGLLLFYNEDMLKGSNITVPKTWVDVQKAVQPTKLTVKEKGKVITAGIALGTAENIEHFSDILGLMMLQNGTKLSESFLKCNDSSTNTCAIEALSFYHKFAESPDNTWDETLDNSILAFSAGRVAMIFAPSWQAFTINTISPNLNFKTAPVPQLPCEKEPCQRVDWATYWVEGVSNKSKYQKEAWEFLKYLSQAETMKKLYTLQATARKLFGEPYSRVDLAKTLSDNPYLAPIMEEAPNMKSFYSTSRTADGDSGLNSRINKYLKDAINSLAKGTSPETALQTAENGLKETYSFYKIGATAQ